MRINFTESNEKEIADLYSTSQLSVENPMDYVRRNIYQGEIPRYLYLINLHNTDHYKIGITNNLGKRIKTLQTGNSHPLNYAFVVKADLTDILGKEIEYLERFLHENYSSKRIRGEWFKLNRMDICKMFIFLTSRIYSRDLPVDIPSDGELKSVFERLEMELN